PGDPLRDVHWGATAHMSQIMVKSHDYTANPKLYLLVNVQRREDQWDEVAPEQEQPLEELISLAATYAAWARDNGVDTAFGCNARLDKLDDRGISVPFGGGEGHYQQMMAAMARLRLLRRRSFPAYLEEEILPSGITGADLVILSLYWSPKLEQCAQRLRLMGNSVTWQGAQEVQAYEAEA
ncbi:MAG: DUF58 domain-containing protein, partial [Eubacteriales bacterium]|nr:DUF58 domain-containing protein [Eubacteriales bacterium]